jgi:RNA polymerase sigma-70 factor (ECF subfamily)
LNQIAALKKAGEPAFLEVYKEFHVRLYYYFMKRTHEQETAKELTQQTFIKLWQFRTNLSESHTLDTQCFTIANSILVDHLRRLATERKHQDHLEQERNRENALYVSYSINDFESSDYLKAIADKLPPVRKNIFMLKIVKGYSNREIAEQLSISIKTVEDHYTKAMHHIRSVVSLTIFILLLF